MIVLALDTATPDTVVGLRLADGATLEARHAPAPGERPGHAAQALALAQGLLDEAGLSFADVDRLGAGVGPGTFTGLRIGLATVRGLAQATRAQVVPVSTLHALALAAADEAGTTVLAAIDARRKEAYVAAWRDDEPVLPARAAGAEALGQLAGALEAPVRSVGDGSLAFRAALEASGVHVPDAGSPLHRVSGPALCALALAGTPVDRDALLPDYVRDPDALPKHLRP